MSNKKSNEVSDIPRCVRRFGDETEEISKAELYLIRRVLEASSDLVKARNWPEFAEFCGGIQKLERELEAKLVQLENWCEDGVE